MNSCIYNARSSPKSRCCLAGCKYSIIQILHKTIIPRREIGFARQRREREDHDRSNDNFSTRCKISRGPIQRWRRAGERRVYHRIVSRFIAPVWNNESTEMSNLLALSAHDERGERDSRHGGASGIRRYQTRWWYFNPLTERNFPPLCIFLRPVFLSRFPKTNLVGA